MNQTTNPQPTVADCLAQVRSAIAQASELESSLNQRAAALSAMSEELTGRLRALGVDSKEEIEKIYASLDADTKARAQPVDYAPAAPTGQATKPNRFGRTV
jgi:hypothetical protein